MAFTYESGRVAACVNRVNDYQRSFQFYQDNAKRTLLATFDEHAVGSAGHPKGKKLLLTKDGGMILQADDVLVKRWRWDPKAQHAGTVPHESVIIPLNDALLFTFKDRSDMTVKFTPAPGIVVTFDCGERLRRTDSYLDHAHRATHGAQRGKLVIVQDVPTLQQRQKQIELASIEKRSKQKPRSRDLTHDQLKTIVSRLEGDFDSYEGCRVTPCADGNWKEAAQEQSLREIPRLPSTGAEIGNTPTLFGSPVQVNDATESLRRLRHPENGKWLGSVELRAKLGQENPTLARKGPLTNASGRYTRELAVSGYVNGHRPARSEHLPVVSAAQLDKFLRTECSKEELVVIACLRADDPQSRATELVLEQVQAQLTLFASDQNRPESPPSSAASRLKCRLAKCDLAESKQLAERYRIRAAPTFLVLQKEAFQWDLALSGDQAVAFLSRLPLGRRSSSWATPAPESVIALSGARADQVGEPTYGLLEDTEVRAIDRLVQPRGKTRASPSLVCAIISTPHCEVAFASSMCDDCRRAQGRRVSSASTSSDDAPLACPHCFIISATSKVTVVSPAVAETAAILVYKHIKAATLHRLVERWLQLQQHRMASTTENYAGLTVESFFIEMEKHYANAQRGSFLPDSAIPPVALSAAEVVLPTAHIPNVVVQLARPQ
ncbi:hypothetical protein P43SY_009636 [Pythium insidiosum]|uniref:FAM194 C-terminal domain-containing protein n=1 Tax=Pythium insidiosum TaxID=114742 RepID=A0AAD5LHZ3_PYTIN|nr:hypothetical protein P43SY_009636 [Pythium insidiosum]